MMGWLACKCANVGPRVQCGAYPKKLLSVPEEVRVPASVFWNRFRRINH